MQGRVLLAGCAAVAFSSAASAQEAPSARSTEPADRDAAALLRFIEEPPAWRSPEEAGLDPGAVHRLVEGARDSRASALVVMKDGRVVVDESFGSFDGPTEAMSATKSVVSLAVGLLLDEGRLESLDQPVADLYPEWRQGRKALVTVRHLLAQTSGLRNDPPIDDTNTPRSDWLQMALSSEVTAEPGTEWEYNNRAVNLLAGVVEKASGERLDDYLRGRLFAPLGITDYRWRLDSAGTPLGMAGLQIRPRDLARIGVMLADRGVWRGKRIVSAAWIETSALQASQRLQPDYGLLWWLVGGNVEWSPLIDEEALSRLRRAGADAALIESLSTLKGRVPRDKREAVDLIREALGPDGLDRWFREVRSRGVRSRARRLSPPTSFAARGYLGQYLWVSPKEKLVVVCMHRPAADAPLIDERREFLEFLPLAEALVPPRPPAAE